MLECLGARNNLIATLHNTLTNLKGSVSSITDGKRTFYKKMFIIIFIFILSINKIAFW